MLIPLPSRFALFAGPMPGTSSRSPEILSFSQPASLSSLMDVFLGSYYTDTSEVGNIHVRKERREMCSDNQKKQCNNSYRSLLGCCHGCIVLTSIVCIGPRRLVMREKKTLKNGLRGEKFANCTSRPPPPTLQKQGAKKIRLPPSRKLGKNCHSGTPGKEP